MTWQDMTSNADDPDRGAEEIRGKACSEAPCPPA
jgi:hypothetical protein